MGFYKTATIERSTSIALIHYAELLALCLLAACQIFTFYLLSQLMNNQRVLLERIAG